MEKRFPKLPSLNQVLESPQIKKAMTTLNHNFVVDRVRTFLDDFRHQVATATEEIIVPSAADLADRISGWLKTSAEPELRPVINATGYLVHEGLGGVPLAKRACNAVRDISYGYSSTGSTEASTDQRAEGAVSSVEKLICEWMGTEAALVTNHHAAAILASISAISAGREVVVSRGELSEITKGGGIADGVQTAGAILREVGAAHRTTLGDYEQAVHGETGAILKIHSIGAPGPTEEESVSVPSLAAVARRHNVPLIEVVGSAAWIDFSKFGLEGVRNLREPALQGADLCLFRGDKLLGGPSCGIIAGRKKYVSKIRSHFLFEAVRANKMTSAGLTETLRLYQNQELAEQEIPLLRMLSMPIDNLKLRANKMVQLIEHLPGIKVCEVVQGHSVLDKDGSPAQTIATWCVSVAPSEGTVSQFSQRLRKSVPSVVGRVEEERLLLDLRTIFPEQDQLVVAAFEG